MSFDFEALHIAPSSSSTDKDDEEEVEIDYENDYDFGDEKDYDSLAYLYHTTFFPYTLVDFHSIDYSA